MELSATVGELKKQLLTEVASLFRHDGLIWKGPIVDMLDEFREAQVRAVVFGGTLRSLLISRMYHHRPGRPRDIDVVVSGAPLHDIEHRFNRLVTRRTRFGGLQLKRGSWHFDVWPVGETWALRRDGRTDAGFEALPSTTTFNLEAVAVGVWPRAGHPRELFSGDDQFFEGVRSRTLELNREDNPYPELTVTRALVSAAELRFRVGPRLAKYIAFAGASLTASALEDLQRHHYGHVRLRGDTLQALIKAVAERRCDEDAIALPDTGQLALWREEDMFPKLRAFWLRP